MRTSFLTRLFSTCSFLLLLFVTVGAQTTSGEAAPMLPDRVGDFRARGPVVRPETGGIFVQSAAPEDFGVVSAAARTYTAPSGEAFNVTLLRTRADSGAYALLTHVAPPQAAELEGLGRAGRSAPGSVAFFKGPVFVTIKSSGKEASRETALNEFARLFAETLEGERGSIPALVQHLPDWEKVQDSTNYAVSLAGLQTIIGQRPALDDISFDGGTETVTATYGGARLVIVEFTTPQYASDNDARITQRIQQLRDAGQPLPSAYRRVGNYSVFVFDAPDEMAATQLIDGVKYEKEVRWLGDNPRALERAQRAYGQTTASVILTTLKITGLAIILCLGVGSLFGSAIFMHRRARASAAEVYTDAGGMVRLNIDEITPQEDPSRLLGTRES